MEHSYIIKVLQMADKATEMTLTLQRSWHYLQEFPSCPCYLIKKTGVIVRACQVFVFKIIELTHSVCVLRVKSCATFFGAGDKI